MRCAICIFLSICYSSCFITSLILVARSCRLYILSLFAIRVLSLFLWFKVLHVNYNSCANLSVLMFFFIYYTCFNILRAVVSLFFSLHYSAVFVLNISTTFFISFCFRYFPFLFVLFPSQTAILSAFFYFCNIISCVQTNICLIDVHNRYTCNVSSLNATTYSKIGKI